MLKKILNIGVDSHYDASLKRKIRISNLIAVISLITIVSFLPLTIYLKLILSVYLLTFFTIASVLNFILHVYKKHLLAFYIYTVCGFIYFICATLTFGLRSNLHFFLLVLCMITVVIFDNKLTIKLFISLAIVSFFSLRWFMESKNGFINLPPGTKEIEAAVGNVVFLLLFIISSVFFIFFKNENLSYQKEVLLQKEIIEEKNKDITASITYAKRIQQSLLTTEKYIEKNINRLKKQNKA